MSEFLRADTKARPLGVDRNERVIRGVILAEEGPFKSKGRGSFDAKGIREIVRMGNKKPGGLKSRFTHPTLSNDGLGKFLGRVRDLQVSALQRSDNGEVREVMIARGDLHFADSAFSTPQGDLANYVMDLVEEDPENAGLSLVIDPDKVPQLDSKGKQKLDDNGDPLPSIWYPKALHAVDVVDDGDATRSMLAHNLSIDGLPDEIVHKAAELLRAQFGGKPREFVQEHLGKWMERALDTYWPADDEPEELDYVESRKLRKRLRERLCPINCGGSTF